MTVKFHIGDGTGSNVTAKVNPNGSLIVETLNTPSAVHPDQKIFRQYLTNDGLAAGTNDMQVDGSTTNVPYWVGSSSLGDRYITALSFEIADATSTLSKFGNITALTNGCTLVFQDSKLGDVTIHGTLKSNYDFVRLCLGNPSFGDGTTAFQAGNVVSTSEAYIPVLNFKNTFGIAYGLRIPKNSTKELVLTVRDDTTGVDGFNCIAYGFDLII